MKRLLAKSSATPDAPHRAETLQGHTESVVSAAERLLALRAAAALRTLGIDPKLEGRLASIVRLAAWIHDLGKVSRHFQEAVRSHARRTQLVRHEALTVWLSWPGQAMHPWLRTAVAEPEDYLCAVIAAAGHHRKFASLALAPDDAGAGLEVELLTDHPDFTSLLATVAGALRLTAPPVLDVVRVPHRRGQRLDRVFERWRSEAETVLTKLGASLLAIAKALLIDADVAGSMLPRAGELAGWIDAQLKQRASSEELSTLVSLRLDSAPMRPFQEQVASSSSGTTLVRAGCGTGKTIAAYAWASRQHPGRQLWVTYPTTGTTTEGFRGYLVGAEVEGRLEHGRAQVDIEVFGLGRKDEDRCRDRLEALRVWGAEVVTATVDTVLGLMQAQRRGLYAWAGLCDAAVVFDEVHAYDERMFGTLLRALVELPGLPVLLMTASLPEQQVRALREAASARGSALHEIEGPAELETHPRYRRWDRDVPWDAVESALKAGQKVLWVSNTVARCLARSDEAAVRSLPSSVYHSRFRYIDRVRRHEDLIRAFTAPGPALALTTQVAEMSLDLSADLLVTDLAPVPAMIQRLGRLNRRSRPDADAGVRPVIVLRAPPLPYRDAELQAAKEWLERLGTGPLSQRDLAAAWARMSESSSQNPRPVRSAWLDGGFDTLPDGVREPTPGLTVLLEDDVEAVVLRRVSAERVALPMGPPPRHDWQSWRRVEYLPVAPTGAVIYDPTRGAQWA